MTTDKFSLINSLRSRVLMCDGEWYETLW